MPDTTVPEPLRVWLLTEGYQSQPENIIGIALTNEEAMAWVHTDNVGVSRTATPCRIIRGRPMVTTGNNQETR